jgi:hypothetical protein
MAAPAAEAHSLKPEAPGQSGKAITEDQATPRKKPAAEEAEPVEQAATAETLPEAHKAQEAPPRLPEHPSLERKAAKAAGKIQQSQPPAVRELRIWAAEAAADLMETRHPEELTERPESSSLHTLIPLPLSNQSAQVLHTQFQRVVELVSVFTHSPQERTQ